MENVTVRVHVRTLAEIEREAADAGQSRSEYIRECLRNRHADDRLRAEYEHTLAERERTIERLRNEKQVLVDQFQREEQTEALVRYVEEKKDAGIVQRAKWWLFGRS